MKRPSQNRKNLCATHLQLVTLMAALGLSNCALPPEWENTRPHTLSPSQTWSADTGSWSDATNQTPAAAVASTPASLETGGNVDLRDCVGAALEKNLSVRIATLQQQATTEKIDLAKANFDPSVDLLGGKFSDTDGNEGNAVLRKRFVTGTELRAEAGTLFLDNTDRTQGETTPGTDYSIGIRQPLLNGASIKANRAPIEKARLLAADAGHNTRIQVYETLRGIETAYWTASYAADLEGVLESSLERVREVRNIIAKKVAEGASTNLDNLEADAAVARAESALVNARKVQRDSLDQLWYVMGYEPRPPAHVQLKPLHAANVGESSINAMDLYAKARVQAPEVILLANDIRAQELNVTVARDRALPKVYADLGWGSSSFITGSSSTVTNTTTGSDNEWSALLRLSIPWTFRAERAQLDMARADLARSKVARENGMRLLEKDISETCRAISAAHQKIEAASRGTTANRTKFTEQQLRYESGLATARDVMEAETELRQAEAVELEDRLRLVLASILLARQDGSILERHGLVL